ncbi:MAG: hypothetical protein M0R40_08525 [Firmicutes bacterium]|nr:hypothetical protein [Bacillota bacterium]
MKTENKSKLLSAVINIVFWGAIWGVFEATVGYALHAVSFGYGWLIWYPAACFFLANVYRKTKSPSAVFLAGLLCASVKMLNLLSPIRIDKVINPAISIVFEALAIGLVIHLTKRFFNGKRNHIAAKTVVVLAMNTFWRLMYILYILLLVPSWMRDISVISNADKFVKFFVVENFATSLILFAAYQYASPILKPVKNAEKKLSSLLTKFSSRKVFAFKSALAVLTLCLYIVFTLALQ